MSTQRQISDPLSDSRVPSRFSSLDQLPTSFSMVKDYEYMPLQNLREIRLLVLEPREANDELSCTLQRSSLDESPTYEALSYTWGDPSLRLPIQCESGSLMITTNLHSALRHLCQTDKRVLWVDAICINQNNPAERARQVMLMGDIYSTARRTLVWLGEETDDVAEAFPTLSWMRQLFPPGTPRLPDMSILPDLQRRFKTQNISIPRSGWHAVSSLTQRPWFGRKWVIQEVVKAKEAVVICGYGTLPWDCLWQMVAYVKVFSLGIWLPFKDGASIAPFNNISLLGTMSAQGAGVSTLSELLYFTRQFSCTDDRDHIIALLGIANDRYSDDIGISPDYNISHIDMYRAYATWSLQNRKSLACLSSGFEPLSVKDATLPSWIPDFTSWNHQPGMPRTQMAFCSTRESEIRLFFSADGERMTISGVILDVIEALTSELPTISDNALSRWTVLLKWSLSCKAVATEWCESPDDVKIQDFWRTLTWDSMKDSPLSSAEISHSFGAFMDSLKDLEAVVEFETSTVFKTLLYGLEATVLAKIDCFSTGRLFCRTMDGRLASMPRFSQIGDKICLFYGGNLPYVVRPCGSGLYRFVGDCYVEGVMYGEGMDLGFETEKFTLV